MLSASPISWTLEMAWDSEKFTLGYGCQVSRLKYLHCLLSFHGRRHGPIAALILVQTEPQKVSYCPAHWAGTVSFCHRFHRNLLVLGAETISDEKRWREEKDSMPRWSEGSTFVFWRTFLRPSWTKGKGVEAMVCWVELVITQFTKPCVWNWHGLFHTVLSFNINCCARSLLVVIYVLPFFFFKPKCIFILPIIYFNCKRILLKKKKNTLATPDTVYIFFSVYIQ